MHPPSPPPSARARFLGCWISFFEYFWKQAALPPPRPFMSDDPAVQPVALRLARTDRASTRWSRAARRRDGRRHSGAFEGDPRRGDQRWFAPRHTRGTRREAPLLEERAGGARSSRSRPGGLTVSKRSSARVRAMASCFAHGAPMILRDPLRGLTARTPFTVALPERRGARNVPNAKKDVLAALLAAFCCAQLPSRAPLRAQASPLPATLETVQWGGSIRRSRRS